MDTLLLNNLFFQPYLHAPAIESFFYEWFREGAKYLAVYAQRFSSSRRASYTTHAGLTFQPEALYPVCRRAALSAEVSLFTASFVIACKIILSAILSVILSCSLAQLYVEVMALSSAACPLPSNEGSCLDTPFLFNFQGAERFYPPTMYSTLFFKKISKIRKIYAADLVYRNPLVCALK